jgi:glycerophosphoryl diester phosphodiesterase
MKFIAHRGYSLEHRDNSIDAIVEAIRRGYYGVEIDVQLCKSGELVLFHDVYVNNTFISEMTIEELWKCDVYSLREVYDTVPEIRDTRVFIDIKGNTNRVCEALRRFYSVESAERVLFCSFNRNILYNLPTHFKKGSTFETTFHQSEFDMITRELSAVVLHWTCLDEAFILYCKTKNIQVYTYTHKESCELEYMYRYDVDGIITNGIFKTPSLYDRHPR